MMMPALGVLRGLKVLASAARSSPQGRAAFLSDEVTR
jgi:hypothetical protein